jgi:hypothetical protein
VPTDDPRLEQALHDAAPTIDTAGVVDRVTGHRRRRRRNRRLATSAVALVVALVVGTIVVTTRDDHGSSPHIASPGGGFHARVVDGDGSVSGGAGRVVAPQRVAVDVGGRPLRPPMLVGATALSVASYDGREGVDPSHVVRIDDASVLDTVDLAARVVSLAEGEGARWALTQNNRPTGGSVPDTFVKRIDANGVAVSVPLPTNTVPTGPIAAVSGAVWVPVRDGILRLDPNSFDANHIQHFSLPSADARWVAQVGKFAYVSDGKVLRGLDASGLNGETLTYGPDVLGLAGAGFDSRVLLRAEDGGDEHARVARTMPDAPVRVVAALPDGFHATGLAASPTRFWATGTVDGAPAIALLDRGGGVRATVVLEDAGEEAALVWTGPHAVRAVAGGQLYDITLP